MQMIQVHSKAISAIGYEDGRMKVAFKSGGTYDFCGVPRSVFDAFLEASSKGTYYNEYIRDRYQC